MANTQKEHFAVSYRDWSSWERYNRIVNLLRDNIIETYIDLGANTGGVCQVLMDKIESLKKCYLFEPQVDNVVFLKSHFEENSNVEIFPYGVFYGRESLPLYRIDSNVGGYTAINYENFSPTGDTMECVELEKFNFEKIDFIKMDVEGSEFNIIENSKLLRDVRFIEIEVHPPYGDNMDGFVEDYVKKYLPDHEVVDREGGMVFLKNKRA
jgi:FkbM family methyltransferase